MRFNPNARLDTSQVGDRRGRGAHRRVGGRRAAGGGGLGLVGILVFFLFAQLASSGGTSTGFDLSELPPGEQVSDGRLAQGCAAGADAYTSQDCRAIAVINSVQGYWTDALARSGVTYRPAMTTFFSGGVATACGSTTAAVGPFYCPADSGVYIDLGFLDELRSRFGTTGGPFTEAYVLAHEYGHHVQNLLGTASGVDPRLTGPGSGAVRMELQADCYAGAWAAAVTTMLTASGEPLIIELTRAEIDSALDAAARIGDDYIQDRLGGGQVNPEAFTHGTSAQRKRWFSTGYSTGDPVQCDTFGAPGLG